MHIIQKDTAEEFDSGYGEHIYRLAGPTLGNMQKHSVVYVEIDPGKSNKKHYHPQVEEIYYILSGQAQITLNDETSLLQSGQLVTIPTGTVHKIVNLSKDTKLCFIATCATPWTPDCSVFLE